MILSRGRRYLFVHIPKTGGTSMALALEQRAMRDDWLIGDTPKARRRKARLKEVQTAGRLWKHSTVAEAEGLYSRAELDDLFVFTLVRNPWDRMVSYYHWLRVQTFDHPAVAVARARSFSDFLNHPQTTGAIAANPYGQYMRDGAGRERATLYARLEALEEDLAPLRAHLGFDPQPGRSNASERPADWRGQYGDRDAGLVAEFCAEDIRRFGYAFDPPGVSAF
ncbi:sulfotransferase family 2 domain-containing protein [Roseisalinus antarcticus]|uniref:Sulfotransferase family protein n=1 Tax=Roseisalinus antarcticus TaxID=254357 RepID=A0A1Y5TR20_9RHOB|nr:sulfotransferase family 2 domain-containing protein [Roseisalinus antarcticus]SLN70051.1 Sulfotransferase family protein [Roseisalinus antarcticus]